LATEKWWIFATSPQREPENKLSAFSRPAVDLDMAAMIGDNIVSNRQSKPGALTFLV
jgi:hypothetical protein